MVITSEDLDLSAVPSSTVVQKLKKAPMTVAQSKIGVTLVISKKECERLGYDINVATTKEVATALKNIINKLSNLRQ